MANGKMHSEVIPHGKVQEMMKNELGDKFMGQATRDGKNKSAQKNLEQSKITYANFGENAGGKIGVDGKRSVDSQKSHPNKDY